MKKKKVSATFQSDSSYLDDGECPQCGKPIEWVRESSGSAHNADCRACMVIWNAHPSSVTFDLSAREAELSEFGAMVYK